MADQVSKADRPACASEAFTVSDHLKCGLPHSLLLFAILELEIGAAADPNFVPFLFHCLEYVYQPVTLDCPI